MSSVGVGGEQKAPQLANQFVLPEPKSLQKSASRDCIIVIGRPKDGKTTCVLTASEKFDPTKRGDGVVIDDIGIITADATALAYAKVLGYEFKYWFDLADHLDQSLGQVDKILDHMLARAKTWAKEGRIHTFIFDPVSTLDYFWKGELSKSYEKWALMDQLDLKHKRFLLEKIMPIPCNTILTMHTKTLGKIEDQDKLKSLGLDADDRVVMDLSSWNGPKMYRTQCSLTLPMKKTPGKTYQEDSYALYPRGIDGMESGGRYPQILALNKMPANMRDVFKLIKSANAAKEVVANG